MTHVDWFSLVAELSGNRRAIVIHPIYIDATGTMARAIVLQQILFWSGLKKENEWWYKSHREFSSEIKLSEDTVQRAVSFFKTEGFLETDVRHIAGYPTVHYRLSIPQFAEWIAARCGGVNPPDAVIDDRTVRLSSITEKTTEMTAENKPIPSRVLTPLNRKSKSQNHYSGARIPSPDSVKIDTSKIYLSDPIEVFIHDAYKRERRITFKTNRNEDQEIVATLQALEAYAGATELRRAFLWFLAAEDDWHVTNQWPIREFIKHWMLYDHSGDEETDQDAIDDGEEVVKAQATPPIAPSAPKPPNLGYQWYVNQWNALVPSATVRVPSSYANEIVFKNNLLAEFWIDICRRAAEHYQSDQDPSHWLSLDWILQSKNGVPNWRGFLARKPKKSQKPKSLAEVMLGKKTTPTK